MLLIPLKKVVLFTCNSVVAGRHSPCKTPASAHSAPFRTFQTLKRTQTCKTHAFQAKNTFHPLDKKSNWVELHLAPGAGISL